MDIETMVLRATRGDASAWRLVLALKELIGSPEDVLVDLDADVVLAGGGPACLAVVDAFERRQDMATGPAWRVEGDGAYRVDGVRVHRATAECGHRGGFAVAWPGFPGDAAHRLWIDAVDIYEAIERVEEAAPVAAAALQAKQGVAYPALVRPHRSLVNTSVNTRAQREPTETAAHGAKQPNPTG